VSKKRRYENTKYEMIGKDKTMNMGFSLDNNGNLMAPSVDMAAPVAASGITLTLTTSGTDYTQTLTAGSSYIVTYTGTAGKIMFAGITGVTSTAANREWVWMANSTHIIHMPKGSATFYCESDESGNIVYFSKLADRVST